MFPVLNSLRACITGALLTIMLNPTAVWSDNKTEPSTARELAEKKAAAQKKIDVAFAKWKATLPAEQQKWESVLEENLGGFYLPIYKAGRLKGRQSAWDYVQDDPKLPRVLLIGDSISRGYTLAVRKKLAGKVNLHRAPANCGPTKMGLAKLDIWLGEGNWDLIHFNFGIHDRNTPLSDYEDRLEQIIQRLQKTGARLMWASTTPVKNDVPHTKNKSLVDRNQVAVKLMQKHRIAVNDLYTTMLPKLSQYQRPEDVHFTSHGYQFLGEQVAHEIMNLLKSETD